MSTTATPDVEQKVDATAVPEGLEHLDFEPTCEFRLRHRKTGERIPCGEPARWWILGGHHCVTDRVTEAFSCDPHFKRLMSGGFWRCPECGASFVARLLIRRTEALR